MGDQDARVTDSDATLLERARLGEQEAFGELWRRHYRSGVCVAHQFTTKIDADDLVSEAFTRIYQRVLAGGGPTGAFRPYLYTAIRNLASTWGAASREVQVDEIQDFEDPSTLDDPAMVALDRSLTATAFRALPERWQTVLWYTEVEGMDPHEVAPILGITANSVAALSYRAREGLRKAWLQAHITSAQADGACGWTIARLGDHARNGLSARESQRLNAHLADCASCSILSDEVEEVGSHLAMVLLPLILGGVAGGGLLAALGLGGSAAAGAATVAASQIVVPAVPASFGVLTASASIAAPVAAGLTIGATTSTGAIVVGAFAVIAAVSGGIVAGVSPTDAADAQNPTAITQPTTPATPPSATPRPGTSADALSPRAPGSGTSTGSGRVVDPADVSAVTSPAPGTSVEVPGPTGEPSASPTKPTKGPIGTVLDDVVDVVTPGNPPPGHTAPGGAPVTADVELDLSGTGMPGATVSAQAAGVVYATTKIGKDGTWSLLVTALPDGLDTLQLRQRLTVLGLEVPIDLPLTLDTGPLGIVIKLLN